MTTLSTAEVEEYVQAVRDALADLPAEISADLLEDLPDHLAEIAGSDQVSADQIARWYMIGAAPP